MHVLYPTYGQHIHNFASVDSRFAMIAVNLNIYYQGNDNIITLFGGSLFLCSISMILNINIRAAQIQYWKKIRYFDMSIECENF